MIFVVLLGSVWTSQTFHFVLNFKNKSQKLSFGCNEDSVSLLHPNFCNLDITGDHECLSWKNCMISRWYIVKSCLKIWRNKSYDYVSFSSSLCGCNGVIYDTYKCHNCIHYHKRDTVTSVQAGRNLSKTNVITLLISPNFDSWFNYVPPTYHANLSWKTFTTCCYISLHLKLSVSDWKNKTLWSYARLMIISCIFWFHDRNLVGTVWWRIPQS